MRIGTRQRQRLFAGRLTCATAILLTATAVHAERDATSADTCSLAPGPTRTVTRIIDGETIALDDGKELRLIGALAPRARDANADEGAWPLEEAAKTSLGELTLGKRVELAFGQQREDRYGRHLAHVFVTEGVQRLWVQGELLQLGLARAYGLPGDGTCLAELIANEQIGRSVGAGVWTSHLYGVRASDKTFALMAQRSTFQIVRGKVESVTRTKGAVYLDFGADWQSDFTVSVPKAVLGAHPDFASILDTLKGATVEVRGWIERRNGPLIAITSPAAIRVVGPGTEDAPPADAPVATGPVAQPEPDRAPASGMPKQNRPRRKAPGDVDL